MIDINSSNFLFEFDPSAAVVGVVGHGYVGKAVEYFFKDNFRVLVHDKAETESSSLREVVDSSDIIFVCVPTPMNADGSCHTGIVEEVLRGIVDLACLVGKSLANFVVVIKSTIPPGFTDSMKERHPGIRLVFSPEFLTEANSFQDFVRTNRVILGGDEKDAVVAYKFFEVRLRDAIIHEEVTVACCPPKVAEMVKLFANGILATKVLFCNEIEQVCQKVGVSYEDVRSLACLDERIGASHTVVPGPDGMRGFGGSCFPKDVNSLRHVCKTLGIPEKLFTAVIERNSEVRGRKDWEELKGRAVVDE